MSNSDPYADAKKLLRDGWSDDNVERLTGVSLATIVVLRAEAAAASAFDRRAKRNPPPAASCGLP